MFRFLFSLRRQNPETALVMMACGSKVALASWFMLIDNFSVFIGLDGVEKGFIETVREIPGFLAFLSVYILLFIREDRFALLMLLALGVGVSLTGFFSSMNGLIFTILFASIGFHYFETMQQSLSLQWLSKKQAPEVMANIVAVSSFVTIAVFLMIAGAWTFLNIGYIEAFLIPGLITISIAIFLMGFMPKHDGKVEQKKQLVLKQRYWLYYALTFMDGARRQIFTVFAGFLMVQKFGFEVHEIGMMFVANGILSMLVAPYVGKLINLWGEKRVLILEYVGLFLVFTAYAFNELAWVAIVLYLADHAFFAFTIAQKTYFQKIADPSDIAPTAGVAFTINHIAAVFIPVSLGFVWIISPSWVFLIGSCIAALSLGLTLVMPRDPMNGHETILVGRFDRA